MDFDIGSIDADTVKKLVSDSLTDEVKASISEVLYGFKEYMSSDEVSAQLSKDIRQLITDSMHVNISQDRVLKEVNKLEARYLEYIKRMVLRIQQQKVYLSSCLQMRQETDIRFGKRTYE